MKNIFELCPNLVLGAASAIVLAILSALGCIHFSQKKRDWLAGILAILCLLGVIACAAMFGIAQSVQKNALDLAHGFERVQVYAKDGKIESIVFTISEARTNQVSILGYPAVQVEPTVQVTIHSVHEIQLIQRWLQSKNMLGAQPLKPLAELAGK